MNNHLLYIGSDTAAVNYAKTFLQSRGCNIAAEPSDQVTHLLLNVPTFSPDGKPNGTVDPEEILKRLPPNVTVIGGNLNAAFFRNYHTTDLLRNESYLAKNAAITAECALQTALDLFPGTMMNTPLLILGWGRIGKCLCQLLHAIGVKVTVAARKDADLAMASALGYSTVTYRQLADTLPEYRIIFNTVPAMVLTNEQVSACRADCLKIDLASKPGIGGPDVICARGLPGKLAPEASGQLIADTVAKLIYQQEDPL